MLSFISEGFDKVMFCSVCSCRTPEVIFNWNCFVSFSETLSDQINQDDISEQMVIVLVLSGVALITLVVTIAIVVVVMRKRSLSAGDHTKILAPGTPTRTHAWHDVGGSLEHSHTWSYQFKVKSILVTWPYARHVRHNVPAHIPTFEAKQLYMHPSQYAPRN